MSLTDEDKQWITELLEDRLKVLAQVLTEQMVRWQVEIEKRLGI